MIWALAIGCAPSAMLGTPLPLATGPNGMTPPEVSVALTGIGPVAEPQEGGCVLLGGCEGLSGQVSARFTWRERVDLGGVAFAGNTSGLGAGVYGRFWYVDNPRFRLGGELQVGFAWVAAGVPIAGMVHERVWITANPSIGLRSLSVMRVPVGVAIKLGERTWLSAEIAVGWDPWRVFQDPEAVQLQGSAGVSRRF
ncbi:MAG: hypothetical protein ACI9VR_002167 [Cognaticolwellia sp.]